MAYDPSAPVKKTADQIGHQVVDITQRDTFFSQLQQQGWYMVGNPIQFPGSSDPNTLRYWAREYALTVNGDMIIEVNDPTFCTDPSNTLVFFIWCRRGGYDKNLPGIQTAAAQQAPVTAEGAPAPAAAPSGPAAAPAYGNTMQLLEQQLWRLTNMLAEPQPRFNFQDTGELLYPFVTIRLHAYEHLGGRIMNLYLLKDGIHDYKIIGNEAHGQSHGQLTPYRDEIFSFKTFGKASYLILDEYMTLDQTQQGQITSAIQMFLTQY